MYESYSCSDCNRTTNIVLDHSTGDSICMDCGLVVESSSIDETPEWRKFANQQKDLDRVGTPNGGLITTTTVGNNPFPMSFEKSDRSLEKSYQAFEAITSMCDRLGLVSQIKDRAKEIYSKVECGKGLKGRNKDAILAACLYITCRKEDKPRIVKEICSIVATGGVSKKQFGVAMEFVLKTTDDEIGTLHAKDFITRFGNYLHMSHQQVKATLETEQKSNELDLRRSPVSIAATIIYIIKQLSDDDNKQHMREEIYKATGVSESTFKSTFKDIHPNISDLIPRWYATEDQVRKIC